MKFYDKIRTFPGEIKILITFFVITLNIGFFTGIGFVKNTTHLNLKGIESQYLGNEKEEEAKVMKFKKSEKEILTVIHNHILSFSLIFFLLSGLLSLTSINKRWRSFLMIEPFVSIILTFGGIYLLWNGFLWFKYLIILSGTAMTLTFIMSSLIILKDSLFSGKIPN